MPLFRRHIGNVCPVKKILSDYVLSAKNCRGVAYEWKQKQINRESGLLGQSITHIYAYTSKPQQKTESNNLLISSTKFQQFSNSITSASDFGWQVKMWAKIGASKTFTKRVFNNISREFCTKNLSNNDRQCAIVLYTAPVSLFSRYFALFTNSVKTTVIRRVDNALNDSTSPVEIYLPNYYYFIPNTMRWFLWNKVAWF